MVAKIDVTEIDRYELNVALFVSGFYFVQVFSVIQVFFFLSILMWCLASTSLKIMIFKSRKEKKISSMQHLKICRSMQHILESRRPQHNDLLEVRGLRPGYFLRCTQSGRVTAFQVRVAAMSENCRPEPKLSFKFYFYFRFCYLKLFNRC